MVQRICNNILQFDGPDTIPDWAVVDDMVDHRAQLEFVELKEKKRQPDDFLHSVWQAKKVSFYQFFANPKRLDN